VKELWTYNWDDLTLWLNVRPHYDVDLERCNTSAQALDWLAQVSTKSWATNKIVGALVRKLDEVLYLQANLCPSGENKQIEAWRLLRPSGLERGRLLEGLEPWLEITGRRIRNQLSRGF
jgi:hypothetical protein